MKTVPVLNPANQQLKEDSHFPAAAQRAEDAARRLREAGLIDADGRRVRKDLPPDMREDRDRDFGG